MKSILVFDLDDTILMGTVHHYARPIAEAALLIIDELGSQVPHIETIIKKEGEIDRRRVQEIDPSTGEPFLYSMRRFPGSLVETYRFYCHKAGVDPKTHVEKRLWSVGMQAFDTDLYTGGIHPDACGVLEFLDAQGHVLILCTKGDPTVQNNKIRAMKRQGVTQFARTYIVSDKTPGLFQQIAYDAGSIRCISIGNARSDIDPALEVGYRGVLIPTATWEGTVSEVLDGLDHDRCVVLSDLAQLKTRYEEWIR